MPDNVSDEAFSRLKTRAWFVAAATVVVIVNLPAFLTDTGLKAGPMQ